MTDREKVIKGLECCNAGTMCDECDYHISQFCLHELKADALALIREQQEEIQRLCDALEAVDEPAWSDRDLYGDEKYYTNF